MFRVICMRKQTTFEKNNYTKQNIFSIIIIFPRYQFLNLNYSSCDYYCSEKNKRKKNIENSLKWSNHIFLGSYSSDSNNERSAYIRPDRKTDLDDKTIFRQVK